MEHSERRLYRSCTADFEALVRTATPGSGNPRTADDVCALLERQFGIRIQRYAASLGGHPYGLVLRGTELCIILYERHTSPWHQQGIILHECGHIFYAHRGTEEGTTTALRVLVPDMPTDQLNTILRRTGAPEGHRPEEERQAEAFATVGLAWLNRRRVPSNERPIALPSGPSPDDPVVATVVRRLLDDFVGGG